MQKGTTDQALENLSAFEENETWKPFLQLRGVAFFMLSMDGEVVLKKLVPKVD